jgi:hypothetical protein
VMCVTEPIRSAGRQILDDAGKYSPGQPGTGAVGGDREDW